MSSTPRYLASALLAVAVAITLAPTGSTDPDIDAESAAAVVEQLQEEGFVVTVVGVPSGDTALLVNCVATAIHNPGAAMADATTPDPTTTSPVSVEVACPLQRG